MYSQISVSGEDAQSFLQGQLTQDLDLVTSGHSPLAGWCTPQGRVVAVMRLLLLPGGFGLVMPTAIVHDVIDGLSIYKLRARVSLKPSGERWRAQAIA
ncbi:MAG: hypothetical protein KJO19_05485, partial [Woeseia sp.]|nr:hypothetical protein [Woeseia sp.]MBT8096468.1 hypothetical protein [Woeseia sp.]